MRSSRSAPPSVSRFAIFQHITRLGRAQLVWIALLFGAPFVVYSNNYRHAFHLDDAYTLVTNPSVRSLSTVPRYFVDPGTYTSVREQADYRPILQVTYAINYRMGGYDTWWWHFTQILLHALVTLGLFAFCRRVLLYLGDPHPDRIAFFAALIFAVHPAASGVVNYLNARSSLLTAAFILPALLVYMKPSDPDGYARPQWLAAFLYTLALFTKVEAVGALGALWAFDLWQRGRENPQIGFARAVRQTFDARTLRRLAPALTITVVYFVIRWKVMAPFPFGDSRHAPDVGAYEYLLTQLTAWWYYVLRWVAPVRLVSDYLAYPVFRSWSDPAVLLALGGWLVVGSLLVASWRRAPYLLFLAITALALLSPTSSIAPLAEMVNEHRPYLPIGILSLAAIIPAAWFLRRWSGQNVAAARSAVAAGVAVILVALTTLTYRRNEVFSTSDRFWRDVLQKAPSARAHLNYGVSLMAANDMSGAMRQFQSSLELAPYWYYTHINLGVAHHRLGQIDRARVHYDRAVEYDKYSGSALTWRGEFHLAQREFHAARDDLLASQKVSLEGYRNAKGLAAAYAGLGEATQAAVQADRMLAIDRASALQDAQARFVQQGLTLLYDRKDPVAAAAVFRKVLELNPTHYGATYQLATALDRSGQADLARSLWERVLGMAITYKDAATEQTARQKLK